MKNLPLLLARMVCGFLLLVSFQSQSQNLETQLTAFIEQANFNGSALVAYQGNTVLAQGYGNADHEHGLPNSVHTQHRIGSITKPFTSMAVFILESQGKLKLDATVGGYFPKAPIQWHPITMHQLLTHTSGLTHSWAVRAFARNGNRSRTLDETLELFYEEPLKFEPGKEFHYSGVGYFLLAKIIEIQSGLTYAQFVKKNIFDPLEMKHSGFEHSDQSFISPATGYQVNRNGNRRKVPDFYMPLLTGGGNLVTTVGDMLRWDQALGEKKFLSADSYEKMYRIEKGRYACGWTIRQQGNQRWILHGGGLPGHSAFFLRNPEQKLCVILMSNHRDQQLQSLAFRLANTVLKTSVN